MRRKTELLLIVLVLFVCYLIGNLGSSYSIYREVLNNKIYLSVIDPSATYEISFETDGGSSVSPIYVTPGSEVGPLTIPEKAGFNFVGWYTQDGQTKLSPHTVPTGSETYYAHWVKLVCKKAATGTLHSEVCRSDGSCKTSNWYDTDDIIYYGTIPNEHSPLPGDAYDCDVNNDGTYDAATERFYYIRKDETSDAQAVLVHYTSFDAIGQMDSSKTRGSYAYAEALTYLPNSTVWSNPALKTFDSKVSRFIRIEDIYATCGGTTPESVSLETCQFFLENSRFQSESLGRAGIWIETFSSTSYRIQTHTLNVASGNENTARPVIEIPFNTIDGYKEKTAYTVTFNTTGGSSVRSITVYEGEELGTMPENPTKAGYIFLGWFDGTSDEANEVTSSTVINGPLTVYAKWQEIGDDMDYVFYIPGTCTFGGRESTSRITSDSNDCISTINPTNSPIDYTATVNRYIDTGVQLYSAENKSKDYEIGFTIETYDSTIQLKQATIMNTKLEGDSFPGLVFRRYDETEKYDLSSRKTSSSNVQLKITNNGIRNVKIYRTYNEITEQQEIFYSLDDGEKIKVNDLSEFNPTFALNVWFGATPTNAAATSAQRYFQGTLSNMYIKLQSDDLPSYKVRFNAHDGQASFTEKDIRSGRAVGQLPTATYAGHYFDGWYTQENGGTKITEYTIITGETTFHAHYKDIYYVTFDGDGGTVSINPNTIDVVDGESIGAGNLPTAAKQGVGFAGWYTQGGVKITGNEAITADTTYIAHYSSTCLVEFDGNGGTPYFGSKEVTYGDPIGELPTAEHSNPSYELEGWYLDLDDASTKADEVNTIVTNSVRYYAKWVETNNVAAIGNIGYPTIQEAVDAVPTNGVKTTITVLKTHTLPIGTWINVTDGRNVSLDLGGYTVSANGNKIGVVNNGILELNNGTFTTTAAQGAFNVEKVSDELRGTLIVNDVTIAASGSSSRQGVYNNGGITYINDGAVITTTQNNRASVHNLNNGTLYINGGSITSSGCYGVYNASGSVTIGSKDGNVDITAPTIEGKTYGVVAYSTFNFYDGIIKGKTAAVGKASNGNTPPGSISVDTDETKIADYENNTDKINDIDGDYKTLYLQYQTNKYQIHLDANGGMVSTALILVEPNDPIGPIPTPTNGLYTFDGWYEKITEIAVDDNTVPTGDMNLYAKWTFTPTHGTLDIMNDPMRNYFNSVSTWKTNEATFLTSMENNFNAYNCLSCDANSSNPYQSCPATGEVQCDRPKGYQTGVAGTLNVYLYDTTNQTKITPKVDYVTVTSNGTIYDMIPGNTYYWELDGDPNVYGTVAVTGERRILEAGGVRNIRDLGGMEVDVDGDGTPDGTLKYGILFRGPKINTQDDVASLQTLGITEEVDLRGNISGVKLSNYVPREIVNYEIDKANYPNNYTSLKNALTATMQDVNNGEKIYFHCAIGTDRTGTLAWFLEGLLGVSEEDRIEDYELSYFYGLLNRHRFYRNQPGSGITHRFEYMHNLYDTNTKIYNYYTDGNPTQEEINLINAFRTSMIDFY